MDDEWDAYEDGVEGSIFKSMWPRHKGMPSISKMMDKAEEASAIAIARETALKAKGEAPAKNHRIDWDKDEWDEEMLCYGRSKDPEGDEDE